MAKLRLLSLGIFIIALSCVAQIPGNQNPGDQTAEKQNLANQSAANPTAENQSVSNQSAGNQSLANPNPANPNPANQGSSGDSGSLEETEALLNLKPVIAPASESKRGFSFYTSTLGNHDSLTSWSTRMDSSIRYDFNDVFGVELGVPYYMSYSGYSTSRLALMKALLKNTTVPLTTTYNSLGDVYLRLDFSAPNSAAGYLATITGTAPTGDESTGLSTGRATFDLNNHLEHTWAFFTPEADFGMGDSSALVTQGLRHRTTLGVLSHYKAGAFISFLKVFNLELSGFEDLPVGNQKVYGIDLVPSPTGKYAFTDKTGVHRFNLVKIKQGILEDNGLGANLTLDVNEHFALLGTYQRSLRQSYDLVEFGMSFRVGSHKRTLGEGL